MSLIATSLLDNDWYNFKMSRTFWKLNMHNISVNFRFKCRSKEVNKSMKDFGFEENMAIVSEFDIRMTSFRELNEEDIAKVETVLINEMSKSFGEGKIRIKDISYLGSYN